MNESALPTHAGHRHGGDAFFAADEAEFFIRGGFYADLIRLDAQSGADVLFHRWGMFHR